MPPPLASHALELYPRLSGQVSCFCLGSRRRQLPGVPLVYVRATLLSHWCSKQGDHSLTIRSRAPEGTWLTPVCRETSYLGVKG